MRAGDRSLLLQLLLGAIVAAAVGATAPDANAQDSCDIKVRTGDGAWSDEGTLFIGDELDILGSGFPGNTLVNLLFERPRGPYPAIPEQAFADQYGTFEDHWSVGPGGYDEGVWTIVAFPVGDDPATTDCIDFARLSMATTPGGLCGLAVGVTPDAGGELRSELSVSVGQEFFVWGQYSPWVYVDVQLFAGGDLLRQASRVLADGAGYIEAPLTFATGDEGNWTIVVAQPGTYCIGTAHVTVTPAVPPPTATTGAAPASAPASEVPVQTLPDTSTRSGAAPWPEVLFLLGATAIVLTLMSRRVYGRG